MPGSVRQGGQRSALVNKRRWNEKDWRRLRARSIGERRLIIKWEPWNRWTQPTRVFPKQSWENNAAKPVRPPEKKKKKTKGQFGLKCKAAQVISSTWRLLGWLGNLTNPWLVRTPTDIRFGRNADSVALPSDNGTRGSPSLRAELVRTEG